MTTTAPDLSEQLTLKDAAISDLQDRLADALWKLAEAYCEEERTREKLNEQLAHAEEFRIRRQFGEALPAWPGDDE